MSDLSRPAGRAWLEVELRQERAAVLQLLESRHQLLLQSLDAAQQSAKLNKVPGLAAVVCHRDVVSSSTNVGDSEMTISSELTWPPMKSKLKQHFAFGSSNNPSQERTLGLSDEDKQRRNMFKLPGSVKEAVENTLFEIVFTVLILLAGLFTAVKLQYESFDIAIAINMTVPSATGPVLPESSVETWPGVAEILDLMNYVFGVAFIIEICLKLVGYQLKFFCSAWNIFDSVVVFFWVYDEMQFGELIVNPMVMRLARLARVLRLVRVLKSLQGLDALTLIVTSIQGSFSILFWSLMVLMVHMVLVGMIFAFTLQQDILNEALALEKRQAIYKYFGSFSRTMLTMFEVTLGNWVPVTRMLADSVGEQWAVILISYNVVVGFAVLQVIKGVFMRETFKVAATDDELMVLENQKQKKHFASKMHGLLARADPSGSGQLTRDDFEAMVCDPQTKHWLSALELRIQSSDKDRVWHILDDDNSGQVGAEELIAGFGRIKGPARALDVLYLTNEVKELQQNLKDLASELQQSKAPSSSMPPKDKLVETGPPQQAKLVEPVQLQQDKLMKFPSKPHSPWRIADTNALSDESPAPSLLFLLNQL